MNDCVEKERRRPGATGTPVRLSDGQYWLLANPIYCAQSESLTTPDVDAQIDQLFDNIVLSEELDRSSLWSAATQLLSFNYKLSEKEIQELLSISTGLEARAFSSRVIEALFGSDSYSKGYARWVRATLLANDLLHVSLCSSDLSDVLAVLVATKRTIPLVKFADACRLVDEQARLGCLI